MPHGNPPGYIEEQAIKERWERKSEKNVFHGREFITAEYMGVMRVRGYTIFRQRDFLFLLKLVDFLFDFLSKTFEKILSVE